jgi:hypothetical protein
MPPLAACGRAAVQRADSGKREDNRPKVRLLASARSTVRSAIFTVDQYSSLQYGSTVLFGFRRPGTPRWIRLIGPDQLLAAQPLRSPAGQAAAHAFLCFECLSAVYY